jgi:hypothetical protein
MERLYIVLLYLVKEKLEIQVVLGSGISFSPFLGHAFGVARDEMVGMPVGNPASGDRFASQLASKLLYHCS